MQILYTNMIPASNVMWLIGHGSFGWTVGGANSPLGCPQSTAEEEEEEEKDEDCTLWWAARNLDSRLSESKYCVFKKQRGDDFFFLNTAGLFHKL